MSEITVRYKMTINDLVNFNIVVLKKKIMLTRAVCAFCGLMTTFVSIMADNMMLAIAEVVLFTVIGFGYPYLLKYTTKKHYENAFILDRENQVEFYNDHIVERVLPKSDGAFESELHIPFEKILNITETEDIFLMFISPVEAVGIPQKSFTDEDRTKLKNLIENVFKNKYTRIVSYKTAKKEQSNNEKRG